jgi:hypothetical protein
MILSSAGDEEEFVYSALADFKMLQFNSSYLVPNITRMTLLDVCQKAKTIVILVVCLPWPLEHKSHPNTHMGRQTPIWLLCGAYGRIYR